MHKVKPADAIEAIWAKDVVDLIWEAKRLRRCLRRWRREILAQGHLHALASLFEPTYKADKPKWQLRHHTLRDPGHEAGARVAE
ncbi:hypothetical protein [Methylobacterium sp. WSM2598]|uniref:hypothetical protein n=1 Tax=Methylobacterium sp. WSM2598 TaxID=398261 RepID=UPI000379722F|nr:hypothetical protein [Methylobacterium sp. WSM2598]